MKSLLTAIERAATEGGAPPITFDVDVETATVVPGSPGLYDGIAIAHWVRPESRDE